MKATAFSSSALLYSAAAVKACWTRGGHGGQMQNGGSLPFTEFGLDRERLRMRVLERPPASIGGNASDKMPLLAGESLALAYSRSTSDDST